MSTLPPVYTFASTFFGTALDDRHFAGVGADLLYGGDGNDFLFGDDGNDFIDGGAGDDLLHGDKGDDTLVGGSGNDTLHGHKGRDVLYGGDGADAIFSSDNASTLDGGAGDDVLTLRMVKGASHQATGGTGADTFALLFASDAKVSTITISDFTLGQDSITVDGVALASLLAPGARITLDGATGLTLTLPTADLLRLQGVTMQAFQAAFGLAGNDTVTGSTADDRIFVGEGNNVVDGGAGNDSIASEGGNDLLAGGSGDDTILGGRAQDTILGGDGHDLIIDVRGTNLIDGGAGNDTLTAGRDTSTVTGGTGDDRIDARMEGGGDHLLTGGAGADVFAFVQAVAGGGSHSTITDFVQGEDAFLVGATDGFAWALANGAVFVDTSAGARLDIPGGSVTFAGLLAEDLNPPLILM